MPKVLLYITARFTWIFLFFGTDANENRAHVHIGRRNMDNYCKIWLEPEVSVAKRGDLTESQLKSVLKITQDNRERLLAQWARFRKGENIRIITIKK